MNVTAKIYLMVTADSRWNTSFGLDRVGVQLVTEHKPRWWQFWKKHKVTAQKKIYISYMGRGWIDEETRNPAHKDLADWLTVEFCKWQRRSPDADYVWFSVNR